MLIFNRFFRRKLTIDEDTKIDRNVSTAKMKNKTRKGSDHKMQKKFESLMIASSGLQQKMRVMNSQLRKINGACKKKRIVIKPILKT